MGKVVVLIPAYKPEEKMLLLLESLGEYRSVSAEAGSCRGRKAAENIDKDDFAGINGIVIVDDGGREEYCELFQKAQAMGCRVAHHEVNRGKGAAIRTGIQTAIDQYGEDIHIVTADADGQHLPEDIVKVAKALMEKNKGDADARPVLVLGTRDFSGKDVPMRSMLGNRITVVFFKLFTGTSCSDTQTGLRGIPSTLLQLALDTEGDRYEYEMDFLTEAVKKADLVEVPIETIYEHGNKTSHFRPVRDSLLIYRKPLRYALTSVSSAAVDWTLFLLFLRVFGIAAFSYGSAGTAAGEGAIARAAGTAAATARIGSGLFNFELNRHWSFQSKGNHGREAARYLILFAANILCNAGMITAFSYTGMPAVFGKAIADVTLFIANYHVQKRWVFKKGQSAKARDNT